MVNMIYCRPTKVYIYHLIYIQVYIKGINSPTFLFYELPKIYMQCLIHKLQIIYEDFFWNSIMDHKLNLRLFLSNHVHLEQWNKGDFDFVSFLKAL
jgi:hypothetical protein